MKRTVQVLSGPMEGFSFTIEHGNPLTVGRGLNNHVVLGHDPCMSTKHAILRVNHQQFEVSDQNSSNGTFLDSRKLAPGKFYPVNDIVVLGSTVMTIMKTAEENNLTPISSDSSKTTAWKKYAIYQAAVEQARANRDPFVSVYHLFLALAVAEPALVKSFLSPMNTSVQEVEARWNSHRFFEIPFRWLNDFVKFQLTSQPTNAFFVSPKVQAIMEIQSLIGDLEPDRFLKLLLDEDYNILFGLLDWQENKTKWFAGAKKTSTTRAKTQTHETGPMAMNEELILPVAIWSDLKQAMARSGLIVLQGSKGCGKTAVMHRVFHPLGQFEFPREFADEPTLYDSRVFVIFNQPEHLRLYVDAMIRALARDCVVGIDHLDHLLESLQECYLDRGPLIHAIRNRRAILMLAIRDINLDMIRDLFRDAVTIDLDRYVSEVSTSIHEQLIKNFEHRVRCLVSNDARDFFNEFIVQPAPNNIDALEDFLNLCVTRSHGIDFPFKELAEETRAMGMLGKAFFRDIYDDWVGKAKTTTSKQPIVQRSAPPVENQTLDLLLQLETLIHTFVKNEFKVSLHYSDQTRSITEERLLTQEQKIEELKSQMVVLLTAYQSSFRHWFYDFWSRIDPEQLKKIPGVGNNAKKLWTEYAARANLIDTSYAEDHFHEVAARVFMDMWKSQKNG